MQMSGSECLNLSDLDFYRFQSIFELGWIQTELFAGTRINHQM